MSPQAKEIKPPKWEKNYVENTIEVSNWGESNCPKNALKTRKASKENTRIQQLHLENSTVKGG